MCDRIRCLGGQRVVAKLPIYAHEHSPVMHAARGAGGTEARQLWCGRCDVRVHSGQQQPISGPALTSNQRHRWFVLSMRGSPPCCFVTFRIPPLSSCGAESAIPSMFPIGRVGFRCDPVPEFNPARRHQVALSPILRSHVERSMRDSAASSRNGEQLSLVTMAGGHRAIGWIGADSGGRRAQRTEPRA